MNKVLRFRMMVASLLFIACGCWQADEIVETPKGPIRLYYTVKRLDSLSKTFIPPEALNVRLHYSSNFGGQSYSVSCYVKRKDLDAFAHKGGYVFKPAAFSKNYMYGDDPVKDMIYIYNDHDPVLCDAPEVQDGLPVSHHFDGYLVCKKEHDGRHYEFLYDKKCEILYVHYFD